jgi:hypothetical protein
MSLPEGCAEFHIFEMEGLRGSTSGIRGAAGGGPEESLKQLIANFLCLDSPRV